MPRRLVALFDGTWDKTQTHTNVARFRDLIARVDSGGRAQPRLYVAGVGVKPGLGHWLGGAFGLGLARNIKRGYRWLCESWQVGDEVWLLGFSRGAYTARSLGGLIRKCGLLPPADSGRLPDVAIDAAYAYYRNGVVPGASADGIDPTAAWRARRHSRGVGIRCVGVWETVGDLGIPGVAAWVPFSRRRYAFHDTALSRIVEYAYQALALDEHRPDFKPTKWTRLPGSLAPGESAVAWKAGQVEVEQRWFVGAHSDVGGGEAADGAGHRPDALSGIALAWMQARAAAAGLAFTDAFVPARGAELDVPNPSYKRFLRGFYQLVRRRHDRVLGGGVNETIDPSVWLKWYLQPQYRPVSVSAAIAGGLIALGSSKVGQPIAPNG